MVTKKPSSTNHGKERFNAVSWLAPFDNYVWLMIVVTIIVSAVIYYCLEVLNPDSDQRKYQLDAVETLWLLAMYVHFVVCLLSILTAAMSYTLLVIFVY
jgi:ABC-type multidrug transport system permease subunit